MSDPSSLVPPSVDRTFILTWGVAFIAYTLDTAFWGVAVISVLQYFRKYTGKDPLVIRSTVALLAFFTTVHSVFLAMRNYKEFVLLFGNFEGQNSIAYETNVAVCSEFLVAFIAQMFYASRIWILSNQDWRYVTPVILLALLQLAAGIAQTVEISNAHHYSELESIGATQATQAVATLACDVAITGILSHMLRRARIGVRRTDSVLDKMILYAFSRGAMTSLLALLQFIFFIAMPGTFIFTIFVGPSCHVYVISVCSMLTSRETLRADMTRRSTGSFAMPTVESNSTSTQNNLANESIAHGVHVSTSVVKWVESIPADDDNMENRDAHKMHLRHTVV
ncbi:hypothetical protein B0H11DRAFT_1387183 [Mycena galericulata]|nr:hypothetical protein B0H11DRAFT_1387183 [Mycena galericulata]